MPESAEESHALGGPVLGGFRARVLALLTTIFNIGTLALCVSILSLGIVSIPLALSAASTSLYAWRVKDEERVVRSFWLAVINRPLMKSAVMAPAVLGVVLGTIEFRYFGFGKGLVSTVSAAMGLMTACIALGVFAYLLLLVSSGWEVKFGLLWRTALVLAGRSLGSALPLLVVEAATATAVAWIAPALVVVCVPAVLLWVWQRTTTWGWRRAGVRL